MYILQKVTIKNGNYDRADFYLPIKFNDLVRAKSELMSYLDTMVDGDEDVCECYYNFKFDSQCAMRGFASISYKDHEDIWYIVEAMTFDDFLDNEIENLVDSKVFSCIGNPCIKRVIFNDPATIVFWDDDSKTVVKCQNGDTFSKETGLMAAMLKRFMGNDNTYNKVMSRWLNEEN